MKGFRILKLLVYLEIILLFFSAGGKEEVGNFRKEKVFLIHHSGRYWWADWSGEIVATATPYDSARVAVIDCVDLEGLRVKNDQLEAMRTLKDSLDNPDLSLVCVSKKLAIFRKGIMVYFHRWEEFAESVDGISEALPKMVPGSVLELFGGGNLLVLKGGWRWPDTRSTPP